MSERLRAIVLASASPRRLALLRSLGLEVRVVPSMYAEPPHPELTPARLAGVHAREKCEDVRARIGEELVVAADTVVDVDGLAFNKPSDPDDAMRMLEALSGRTHIVHTAYALAADGEADLVEHVESTRVTFHRLEPDEIREYVASGEPMDKAGAYGIQGYGAALVERIDGDFYTVMGFPVAHFVRSLRRLGFVLPVAKEAERGRHHFHVS